jgi:predicted DNA-binding WGR domain protein
MKATYLKKQDWSQNMNRFYLVSVMPTLFGDWVVVREWGRIGQPGQVRETWFDSETEAAAAGAKTVMRKKRRGYRPIPPE